MKIKFFLFFLLCVFYKVSAQNEVIHGRVMSDSLPLAGVHIQNLQKEVFTTTNADGYFSIKAVVGNTLQLTHVGLQTTFRKIVKEDFQFSGIRIQMKPQVTELEGVEVSKYVKLTPQQLGILQHETLERTFNEKQLYASAGGGGAIIDALINAITGRTKMLKKMVINDQNMAVADYIRTNMSDFLKKELKITDEDVLILAFFVMEKPEIHQVISQKNDGELKFLLIDAWNAYQKASKSEK